MSELKAINAYRLTTNTEDSDVYIHNDEFGCGGDLVECYLKSEADKVIAKLENENERLKKQSSCTFSDDCLRVRQLRADYKEACGRLQTANLIKDEQLAATRHSNYKRCLAMAERCKFRMYYLSTVVDYESSKLFPNPTAIKRYTKKESRMDYWKNRWLELAEKFKETNNGTH